MISRKEAMDILNTIDHPSSKENFEKLRISHPNLKITTLSNIGLCKY